MAEVVDVLARNYAGVNMLHSFVEGNGRRAHLLGPDGSRCGLSNPLVPDRRTRSAEAFGVGPVRNALVGCVERLPACCGKEAREALQHSKRELRR
jgi:hypothetical protein